MGVARLWTFIKENKKEIVEYVDLVEVAKNNPKGIKVLIDFYSWEQYIKGKFWKTLELVTGNPYLYVDGGEYDLIDNYIKSFITAFRNIGIEFVFFLDGAKGSSYQATRQKMKTWQRRHWDDQKSLAKCMAFLRGQIPGERVTRDSIPRPCLQEVQNILTLQESMCKIHQRVSGEADNLIAQHMKDDSQAYCVFSNDTDFCIFEHSKYLSSELFDLENHLGLGGPDLTIPTPEKLMCGIISTANVAKFLRLSNEELIELSILGGNDFTSPLLHRCVSMYSEYIGQFELLSAMVKEFKQAENCPGYSNACSSNAAFQEAVEHSRKFYRLDLEDEEKNHSGFIFLAICEGIQQIKYPSTIAAMYHGFYWRRHVMEDPTPGLPTADGALSVLRSYIYAMVLSHVRNTTVEYGRTPSSVLDEVQVAKAAGVPTLAGVKKNCFSRNMSLFEWIISHQEINPPANSVSLFKRYGIKRGFLCHLLRYFLLLNWRRNLFMSVREFFVLIAWVLGDHNHTRYRKFNIVPSPRCVTVENWFLALFRNAYAFLGSLLGLAHEFPAPRSVFSGATWVALYTSYSVHDPNPDCREPRPLSVPREDLDETCLEIDKVVKEHRHIIENIIKDVFPFESRHN